MSDRLEAADFSLRYQGYAEYVVERYTDGTELVMASRPMSEADFATYERNEQLAQACATPRLWNGGAKTKRETLVSVTMYRRHSSNLPLPLPLPPPTRARAASS
jgi:hypothetical protein